MIVSRSGTNTAAPTRSGAYSPNHCSSEASWCSPSPGNAAAKMLTTEYDGGDANTHEARLDDGRIVTIRWPPPGVQTYKLRTNWAASTAPPSSAAGPTRRDLRAICRVQFTLKTVNVTGAFTKLLSINRSLSVLQVLQVPRMLTASLP